ncbi:MAG: NUDIX hydrolase [Bacteroidales bacterium]|nr:NUDIX hydrolase [Bacteroidales bacterium]
MSYTYKYPHPAIAADCLVFSFDGQELNVLLIERGSEPCKGMWAFPGGFMNIDETAEECATRELKEETGLDVCGLKQLGAFSAVHRDPRERVVSVAFYVLVSPSAVSGGDDARDARWFPIQKLPPLAFDHENILRKALLQLRKDSYFEPVGLELLPREFHIGDLRRLYEAILGVQLDHRNFERKILKTGVLQIVDDEEDNSCFVNFDREESRSCQRKKPEQKAKKYAFDKNRYNHFKQNNDFRFEL